MATTIPEEFLGNAWLTDEKVEVIKAWYVTMLGDSDKADDTLAEQYYTGQHEALRAVLILLHEDDLEVAIAKIQAPDVPIDCSPSGC